MNRKDELNSRLRAISIQLYSLGKQVEGTRLQYEAACISSNNEKADACRAAIHDLTDMMLDAVSEQMLLCKSISEIPD